MKISLQERERNAAAYAKHPALLRVLELETLRELGTNANARIYIGFDKHGAADTAKDETDANNRARAPNRQHPRS
jgi:hypothetical protein